MQGRRNYGNHADALRNQFDLCGVQGPLPSSATMCLANNGTVCDVTDVQHHTCASSIDNRTANSAETPTFSHTFAKMDGYGDGWGGANYIIHPVGSTGNQGMIMDTLADGAYELDHLCLSSGCYTLTFTAAGGNRDTASTSMEEISWLLCGLYGDSYGDAHTRDSHHPSRTFCIDTHGDCSFTTVGSTEQEQGEEEEDSADEGRPMAGEVDDDKVSVDIEHTYYSDDDNHDNDDGGTIRGGGNDGPTDDYGVTAEDVLRNYTEYIKQHGSIQALLAAILLMFIISACYCIACLTRQFRCCYHLFCCCVWTPMYRGFLWMLTCGHHGTQPCGDRDDYTLPKFAVDGTDQHASLELISVVDRGHKGRIGKGSSDYHAVPLQDAGNYAILSPLHPNCSHVETGTDAAVDAAAADDDDDDDEEEEGEDGDRFDLDMQAPYSTGVGKASNRDRSIRDFIRFNGISSGSGSSGYQDKQRLRYETLASDVDILADDEVC